VKYRHLLDDALRVSDPELALLAVLMLRGPQTLGELKQRSERMHAFASLDDVREALETLCERGLAARLPRRPGQKEERYAQLLGGDESPPQEESAAAPRLEERIERLEEEVASLRRALAALEARGGAA
jgi:uncharacterized protein YceH (UPF0502 family)